MVNRKLLIIAMLGVVLFMINYKPKLQTVVPACFEKEDCRIPVTKGYCDVSYDCIVGKCYSEPVRCLETCSGGNDEDYDSLIDCKDDDCFSSPYCPCELNSYNWCIKGRCYCPEGKQPLWFVFEDGTNQCICN